MQNPDVEQEIVSLSKEKWRWMSERKIDSLDALFHEKAVFVPLLHQATRPIATPLTAGAQERIVHNVEVNISHGGIQ